MLASSVPILPHSAIAQLQKTVAFEKSFSNSKDLSPKARPQPLLIFGQALARSAEERGDLRAQDLFLARRKTNVTKDDAALSVD